MDKPGGFPDRALIMIVSYGPAGGPSQVAAGGDESARPQYVKRGIYWGIRVFVSCWLLFLSLWSDSLPEPDHQQMQDYPDQLLNQHL